MFFFPPRNPELISQQLLLEEVSDELRDLFGQNYICKKTQQDHIHPTSLHPKRVKKKTPPKLQRFIIQNPNPR